MDVYSAIIYSKTTCERSLWSSIILGLSESRSAPNSSQLVGQAADLTFIHETRKPQNLSNVKNRWLWYAHFSMN